MPLFSLSRFGQVFATPQPSSKSTKGNTDRSLSQIDKGFSNTFLCPYSSLSSRFSASQTFALNDRHNRRPALVQVVRSVNDPSNGVGPYRPDKSEYEPRVLNLSPLTVQDEVKTHLETTTEPHFTAPLGIRRNLPLFVFLPGLDGTGMYISSQLEGLAPHFDVRCLCIPVEDRSSYAQLAAISANFIAQERMARGRGVEGCSGGAPVTVAGESFGGPVALRLAVDHPEAVQVLLVINSGSGLRRHPLLFYGSYLIPIVPKDLYDVSAYCITPFLSDVRRLEKENVDLMMPPMSVQIVPKDTVHHRVRLMADFAMRDSEIATIQADTLCVASVRDRLLPSLAESRRLTSLIKRCQLHLVSEASHTVLLESDTDLAVIMQEHNLLPPANGYMPGDVRSNMWGAAATAKTGSKSLARAAALMAQGAGYRDNQAQNAATEALKATQQALSNPDDSEAFQEANRMVSRLLAMVADNPEADTSSSMSLASIRGVTMPPEGEMKNQLKVREKEAEIERKLQEEEAEKIKQAKLLKLAKYKGTSVEELTGAAAGAAIDRMMEEIPQMRAWNWLTRPEFFGIENIPTDEKPLLFVGNHTIYGLFDMPLMIYEVRKQTGITLRGLAHPLHYMSAFGDLLARYGATKATPRNCFKLLQTGQAVLLYPGGAREVAKRKGEKYKLMWKEDAEFVRLAMKFGCTIVPFASVGTEEAFDITVDSQEIMDSPLGPGIERILAGAGLDTTELPIEAQDVIPPIATGAGGVPFLPSPKRLYFKFHEPIRTDCYEKKDINDKEICQGLYEDVKTAVESTIVELHEIRDKDPLQNLVPRTILSAFELWDGT